MKFLDSCDFWQILEKSRKFNEQQLLFLLSFFSSENPQKISEEILVLSNFFSATAKISDNYDDIKAALGHLILSIKGQKTTGRFGF